MGIKIEDLTVTYDVTPVLWDIDLTIKEGSLTAIVGPNGAGKSTLIKAMLGLVKRISGEVLFSEKNYKEMHKKIAYVPQRGSVDWDFPTTVYDVVLMGRYGHIGWFRKPSKTDHQLTIKALEEVGMINYQNRQISELSGGQQQRVFLARALVQAADFYIMDEPFQGVDIKTEKAIIKILKLLKEEGKTVVVVHHDLDTVSTYFDEVVLINVKLIAQGAVNDVFTAENIKLTYQARDEVL